MLLLLLILGLVTYLILRRGVTRITRTPIWLLWLVMMAPALIWSAWMLVHGTQTPIPSWLVVIPFVACPCLYWVLVQMGRQPPPEGETDDRAPSPTADAATPQPAIPKLPEKAAPPPPPITPKEEEKLRTCFPWAVFPLQNLEYRPQAVICRGQLRSQPEVAYKTVRENIEANFGDRFLIVFQKDFGDKPLFALVQNPYRRTAGPPKPDRDLLTQPLLALALLVITLFTTTVAGTVLMGVTNQDWQADPALLGTGLPYALALMAILGVHEGAHYLSARSHGIKVTLPYFIPVPFFLGTFGAFIQTRSPIPNRKALFDVSIAGPWAGLLVTIPLLIWGFAHSEVVSVLPEEAGILTFNALDPSFSILLTVLGKVALGDALTATGAIDLHPVAIAGYIGLVVSAFNLLPIGQLDGGHMVHAMFGQRTSLAIGQITRFLVLFLALVQQEFLILAVLLFFLPLNDEPALNDVSELDDLRDFIGLITLGVLLTILLPLPNALAQFLNY
ncbi:site-2 protease family protein [Lyngbya sp. CCY1209]|uniref:site-2 protease family protein n=1 Tax=Lyngbya sp. CCY1209 TaxID=2886103 RepID=UPI002D208D59|nr:site-2 protease family protein [Lyngbya sp. CCY1209]MEB3885494.1 site-2 protease family protein [Lyngbya sp. CCY1209]